MADSSKSAVPKFSSFKPKATPGKETSTPEAKEDRGKDEKREKRKDSHRDRHEDVRRHKSTKDHDRRSEKDHRREREKESSKAIVELDTSDLAIRSEDNDYVGAYRIDTTGDVANLKYGSLHRYSIPAYRRSGYGNVMGAGTRAKIDRALSDEKGIVVDTPGSSSSRKSRPLLKASSKDTRSLGIIRSNTENQRLDHDQDFLALLPSRKRKRGSESPISEHGEVDYRSIEGKAKEPLLPNDPDLEYLTDSSAENGQDAEMEVAARRTNAQLFRRTRDDPHNLTCWLELIEHQAVLLGFRPNETLSSSEQRSLADMRLSIYEEALKAIGNDLDSRTTLQLDFLEEGAKVWEASRLSEQWEKSFHANKYNIRICIAYLNFVQTNFTSFDYEKCKTVFLECLRNLNSPPNAATSASTTSKGAKATVYIFLRLTVFMREAGYHEFAEALWQAVLELQLYRPSKVSGDIAASFEQFWESEVPRIGDRDSKGWDQFQEGIQDSPEPINIMPETVDDDDKHIFRKFAKAELLNAQNLELLHPGRSSDDTGEDDPYHMVLFRDVEPILFPAMLGLTSTRDLIPAFLVYLGMPPLPDSESREYEDWWLDPFVTMGGRKSTGLDSPIIHRHITTDILFSDPFAKVDQLNTQRLEARDLIDKRGMHADAPPSIAEMTDAQPDPLWIRRVLKSLVDANPYDDKLAEYFLAVECATEPENAAKCAKRLLKARPNSLRLYNIYGIIQTRLKGQAEGSGVLVKTLSMAKSLGSSDQNYTILLWRTWVFEALGINAIREAIRRLLCVGTASPSPVALDDEAEPQFSSEIILRTKRFLNEGRDGMLSAGLDHLAVLYVELLALFAYFRSSGSLQAGLDAYVEASELFKKRGKEQSPGHEHLHQARAAFLALHQKRTPLLKPSIVRGCLVESVTLFPNNTIFLTAYTNNEKRFRLDDRVRAVLSKVVLQDKNDTIAGWSFAIWNERQRGLEFGGTPYAIRAVFDKAVQRSGKHNIGLWQDYFLFEMSLNDKQRAKQVFFRGLTNLPWSKWYILLAFEHLDGYLSFEEMRSIWRVLGEKDLRIVVDIQDRLDDIAEKKIAKERRIEDGRRRLY